MTLNLNGLSSTLVLSVLAAACWRSAAGAVAMFEQPAPSAGLETLMLPILSLFWLVAGLGCLLKILMDNEVLVPAAWKQRSWSRRLHVILAGGALFTGLAFFAAGIDAGLLCATGSAFYLWSTHVIKERS